jgi:hypothetical protein
VRLDEILLIFFTVLAIVLVVIAARKYGAKPHKTLSRLVLANIILDLIAVGIWLIPATQWSIYRLGFTIVVSEALVAAAVFAIIYFGLRRNLKWAPYLAIALTVTQRVFATYVFFPSTAIGITTIWSILIIYFAYRTIKTQT